MPLIHIEKEVLELIIDCLVECGHEDQVYNIIYDDSESEEEIKESSIEQKTKDRQTNKGRVNDNI